MASLSFILSEPTAKFEPTPALSSSDDLASKKKRYNLLLMRGITWIFLRIILGSISRDVTDVTFTLNFAPIHITKPPSKYDLV